MKTPLSFRHLALLCATCALGLTSCGVPYDHRSYVRGTGYGADHEPVPTQVIVKDPVGDEIVSGHSNRDSYYYGRQYHANRYYGGMYYGYNNPPVSYATEGGPYDQGRVTYLFQSAHARDY